ncbi:MAG: polyphosphate polymerase domain-containing protein [Clostridia bacterium]|nr:polyphosphate polymerase domain-containing protein [Clostridia bacterium]
MAVRTFKRYEKKYLLSDDILDIFLQEVRTYMNPDAYCVGGEKYTIHNIYFDDDRNSIIRHSLSKPYYKEKLRLRDYAPFKNPGNMVYLELKKKIGGIVSKRRSTMTLADAIALTEKQELHEPLKYLDKQVAEEILFFLKQHPVKPKANISYDRQAFFGKEDGGFRLTVDSNIKGRSENLFSDNDTNNISLLENGLYIMEVKILGSMPLWLARIISELDIKKVSFSKYGTFYKKKLTDDNNARTQTRYPAFVPEIISTG